VATQALLRCQRGRGGGTLVRSADEPEPPTSVRHHFAGRAPGIAAQLALHRIVRLRRADGGPLLLLEIPHPAHVLHVATTDYLARIRGFVAGLATEASVDDPDSFARQWHILMKGSTVAASEGDRAAARCAREFGAVLLQKRLPFSRRRQ